MTEDNEKEPGPSVKPVTGRFRATRLSWLRPQAVGASGAALNEAIASTPEQQPLDAPSADQRRLTVLTRLSFIPDSLAVHGRRLRWRRRAPLALGLLALSTLLLWLFLSHSHQRSTGSKQVAERALTKARPQARSTAITPARSAPPELLPLPIPAAPSSIGQPPDAPARTPTSVPTKKSDAPARKPASAPTEQKTGAPTHPQAEDTWL